MTSILGILVLAATSLMLPADLTVLEREANLEKRSQLALDGATKAFDEARKAYSDGEFEAFERGLGDTVELAELSYKSLKDTGKSARRSPKYWKRAEQRLRELSRRVDSFEKDVSLDDRGRVQDVEKRLHELHEQVLNDIMTKK